MKLILGSALALVGLIAALYTPLMEWRERRRRKGRAELEREIWYEKASLRAHRKQKGLPQQWGGGGLG